MSKSDSKFLSLAEILAARDCPVKFHHVESWGGSVRIRKLTTGAMADLDEWRSVNSHPDNVGGMAANTYKFMIRFISACLVDEAGEPLFQTDADCDALLDRSADVVGELFLECRVWNGWNPDEDASGN